MLWEYSEKWNLLTSLIKQLTWCHNQLYIMASNVSLSYFTLLWFASCTSIYYKRLTTLFANTDIFIINVHFKCTCLSLLILCLHYYANIRNLYQCVFFNAQNYFVYEFTTHWSQDNHLLRTTRIVPTLTQVPRVMFTSLQLILHWPLTSNHCLNLTLTCNQVLTFKVSD